MWLPTMKDLETVAKLADSVTDPDKSKFAADIFDTIRKGRPTFLLFGPGGMGKTIIKEFLQTFSHDNLTIEYRLSKRREVGKLKGRRYSRVYTFPGQKELLENQFDYYKSSIRNARRPIVVIVMSYGHRSVDDGEHKYANDPQLNEHALKEEIEYAKLILGKLRAAASFKRWIILTVVAKADLWWDDREKVNKYYETNYQEIIDDFRTKVGIDKSEHFVLPISLPRTPLRDKNGNIIKKPSSDYDDRIKRMHVAYFVKTINDVLSA